LMTQADLAIGAGGITTWERCCLALPTIVVTTADNQEPSTQAPARDGIVYWLGRADTVTVSMLRTALRTMAEDSYSLCQMSLKAMELTEGNGVETIARWMMGYITLDNVHLRHARGSDLWLYFHWANEPTVRANAFNHESIDLDTHRSWFADRLKRADSILYVLETDSGAHLGQIRFDLVNDSARISYSLDLRYRGKGLGQIMLNMGIEEVRKEVGQSLVFKADILPHNEASRRVFRKCGFELVSPCREFPYETWWLHPDARKVMRILPGMVE